MFRTLPAPGVAILGASLLAGCAYHPPPGGPWAAQMRALDCSGIDGIYPLGPQDRAVSLAIRSDGLQVHILRDGAEMASLHVAKTMLRCVDGWLVIKDDPQYVGDPRRTDRDHDIVALGTTNDGALVARESLAVVPGDKISVSYTRHKRLH